MRQMDRIQGAVLGLALGEALGRLIACDPDAPVVIDASLPWSGGTHGAIYAARTLLGMPLDAHADGWGEAFKGQLAARWADPTTPDRIRSATTVHAMRESAHDRWWRDVGSGSGSDGAEPALRAVPIGCVFSSSSVALPVRIGTEITHRTDNAVQSATFVAHLVGALVRGAPLSKETVLGSLHFAEACSAGELRRPVSAALRFLSSRDGSAERVPDIHPGDGGRRAHTAVGLAVAMALPAVPIGPDGLLDTFRSAACVEDGASVGGLVGAFLGATWGARGIPSSMVEAIEDRSQLIDLGRALYLRSEGRAADLASTEESPMGFTERPLRSNRSSRPPRAGTDPEWVLSHRRLEGVERAHGQATPDAPRTPVLEADLSDHDSWEDDEVKH